MIQLRDYQQEIANRASVLLKKHRIAYLAMECRTGKTLTALAAADMFGALSVLVVSKLKAIPSIQADYTLLKPRFSLDVINYESVHKATGRYDLIVLDEAHSLGAFPKPSQRAKAIKLLCKNKPIIYLSGTPSPESFSQLYHQFWVSSYSPFAQYPNFYKWAKRFTMPVQRIINGHQVNDYTHARKDLIDAMCKHLFLDYTQEEAGFDSKINEHILEVKMNDWTHKALKQLRHDKLLHWDDVDILGDTPAKLMSKLHQLSSGSVIDETGRHILTDYSKAQFIRKRFEGRKIAIFYVYQSEADLLRKTFPNWTDSPEQFQASSDRSMVFIGQVRSAREGVRLDLADALIFYNLEYSYLSYEQGKNRLSSKERSKPADIYFVVSDCGIESDILEAVRGKQDFTASFYRHKYGKL